MIGKTHQTCRSLSDSETTMDLGYPIVEWGTTHRLSPSHLPAQSISPCRERDLFPQVQNVQSWPLKSGGGSGDFRDD